MAVSRRHDKRPLETIPVGTLGLVPLKGCEKIASKIDEYLIIWREERENEHKNSLAFSGYQRDSYIVSCDLPVSEQEKERQPCASLSGAWTCLFWLMLLITVRPTSCSAVKITCPPTTTSRI